MVPALMLVLTSFVVFMVNLLNNNVQSDTDITLAYDTQSAMEIIERDVHISSQFLTTTDNGFTDPYGYNNSGAVWSYKGTSQSGGNISEFLITHTYATTLSVQNSAKSPVYINQFGCSPTLINSNPMLAVNNIYFIRGGNLYRRTLTITSQTTCDPQFQKQTCPPDVSPLNSICKSTDTLLLTNVTSFEVRYYNNPGDFFPIDAYNSNDPNILLNAKTAVVLIGTAATVAGDVRGNLSAIQITRLNN